MAKKKTCPEYGGIYPKKDGKITKSGIPRKPRGKEWFYGLDGWERPCKHEWEDYLTEKVCKHCDTVWEHDTKKPK